MKSILLHTANDTGFESRLNVTLDIARAHEAHITFLQPSIQISPMAYAPSAGHFVADLNIADIQEAEQQFRSEIENRLKTEDVQWDWQIGLGDAARLMVEQSGLADLLVLSQSPKKLTDDLDPHPIAGEVAIHAHAATMVVPTENDTFDSEKPIVVAWNGSKEASLAIRLSLPMMRMASSVHVVTVEEGHDLPNLDASAYLSRHNISSELHQLKAGKRNIAEMIEEFTQDKGASAIVMGAYGKSRLRETLMGGVTRDQIFKSKLPLILAH